jgi:hypothetical protein
MKLAFKRALAGMVLVLSFAAPVTVFSKRLEACPTLSTIRPT